MRSISIPDELASRIEASGAALNAFIVEAAEAKLSESPPPPARTLKDLFDAGWKLPLVSGKPNPGGLAWSEIEAACDAA